MGTYAAKTDVSEERSRNEIERTLKRYGATRFGYLWEEGSSVIMFEMQGRRLKFNLPMPVRSDFRLTENGRARTSQAAIDAAWEQAQRQRWRALLLVIKAKLEAIEAGITSFEDEFLSATLLSSGQTVSQWIQPQIAQVYETGRMPSFLLGPGGE